MGHQSPKGKRRVSTHRTWGGGTGQWPDMAIRARIAVEDVHMGEGVVMKIETGYIIGDGLNKEIH